MVEIISGQHDDSNFCLLDQEYIQGFSGVPEEKKVIL